MKESKNLKKEFFSKEKDFFYKIAKSKFQLCVPVLIGALYFLNLCSSKLYTFSSGYIVSYILMYISIILLEISWIWSITKKDFREKYKYTIDYFVYVPASLGYIINSVGQTALHWQDLNLLLKGDFSGLHNLVMPIVMFACFTAAFGYYGHDDYNYSGSVFVLKTSAFVSLVQIAICFYEIVVRDLSKEKLILAIATLILNISVGLLSLNVTVSTKKLYKERLGGEEKTESIFIENNFNETCEDPFVFISYSHTDSKKVLPIIKKMQEEGYRIWYDAGIDPGTEWDINIASHVEECGYFIAFISKNYINSSNCKDELNFARDLEKKRFLVYIEDVELPSEMRMRLSRIQNIHMYKYVDADEFYSKLFCADGIDEFKMHNRINAV